MVLGIVTVVISFIPACGVIAFWPAIVGFILSIVDVVQKSKKGQPKGMGIAGIVLNAVALAFALLWSSAIAAGVANSTSSEYVAPSYTISESI